MSRLSLQYTSDASKTANLRDMDCVPPSMPRASSWFVRHTMLRRSYCRSASACFASNVT